jgi:hypothetical protein
VPTVGERGWPASGLGTLAPYDTVLGSQTPYVALCLDPAAMPYGGNLKPIQEGGDCCEPRPLLSFPLPHARLLVTFAEHFGSMYFFLFLGLLV